MKPFTILVTIIAVISIVLNIKLLHERKNADLISYKVLEVIDGDTFRIELGGEERRVRLMGVDAPELGKCLGIEAKEKLEELILNKQVLLKDQFSDPYARIMANVFDGEKYINKEILLSGFGRMDYYENPMREDLKDAYAQARNKKVGIFAGICISKTPPISSETGEHCNVKGNIDDNTQKKYYFLSVCRNYSQVTIDLSTEDTWFCSEEEAIKAGFVKSKTC